MLSLGGERLIPTPTHKKKSFGSLPAPRSWVCNHYYGVFCSFTHLKKLEYTDHHHQNLISSSFYYPGPLHQISSQSVHNFLSNVVHRQTDKQTNAIKNITSFAKEVIKPSNTLLQEGFYLYLAIAETKHNAVIMYFHIVISITT